MVAIKVENLQKKFQFGVSDPNKGWIQNLINPTTREITAVDNISFSIERGESIAFIGPNGAGKSTTIKILTGVLYPSSGEVEVAGLNPQKQRKQLSHKIGTVFGQRSQLVFNLPIKDSFYLFGKIYDLSNDLITKRTKELTEIFDLEPILNQPVRKLSLGQRMRAEIAVSLLHNPEIIFLDEPTIGLDVVAKKNLRDNLRKLNKEQGTTIFLTSHDVGDIEALSNRTIVINHGRIIVDKPTAQIRKDFLAKKLIRIQLKTLVQKFTVPNAELIRHEDELIELKVDTKKYSLSEVLKHITTNFDLEDIDVENIDLEEVISHIYQDE